MSPTRSTAPRLRRLAQAFLLAFAGTCPAADFTVSSGPLALDIPDDTDTGLVHSLSLPDTGSILSVTVSLQIGVPEGESGWLGDLYVYVQHGPHLSVLLNRPGRAADRPFGYDDDVALDITFSDAAANGDFHQYRFPLIGSHLVPLAGPITGHWAPDARLIDPAYSLDTTARTGALEVFSGAEMSGTWNLFLADLSGGGVHRLEGWSLEVETGAIVPEPRTTGLIAGLAVGLAACGVRRRRRNGGATGGRVAG